MTELKKIVDSIAEVNNAFAEFKRENDKKHADVSSESQEKLEKISNHMSDLEEKIEVMEADRARVNSGLSPERLAHSDKFYSQFIRGGDDSGIEAMAVQANLSVGTDSDGGLTIPEELDRDILKLAQESSPMRRICTVRSIGGSTYKKLIQQGKAGSGWVGEKDPRPETGTPTFDSIAPTFGEVYANPAATQNMLDDAFFNVEQFLREEIAEEFDREEGVAFISGNGTNKPIGLLMAAMSYDDDASRPFGTVQKVRTGVADGLPSGTAATDLIMDLQDELHEKYQANASFMTHRRTKTALRKLKDADGNYIWQQGTQVGEPSRLFDVAVVTNSDMPVMAANALALAYGDFKKAFHIIDRIGTRILRDPFTNKPFVHFYATKRVGSMHANTEAWKVLECSAA